MAVAREVLRSLPHLSLFLFDHDLRYVFCEGDSLRELGFDPGAMEGATLREVLGDAHESLEPLYRRALAGETLEFERRRDDRVFAVRAAPTRDAAGLIVGASLLSVDVTDRHEADRVLRESLERLDRIATNVPGVVYQVRIGSDGTVSYPYVSDGIRDVAGIEPADLQADPALLTRMIHPDDKADFMAGMAGRLIHSSISQWEGRIVVADGSVRWLSIASRPQAVGADGSTTRDGVAIDVTEKRAAEASTRWHLDHDTLTGLPNQALFLDRLEQALVLARTLGDIVGVCFVGLDRFQQINDVFGHAAGDEVLRTLTKRMRATLRPQDTLARYGGDELTVLLPALSARDSVTELAGRVAEACREPVRVRGRQLVVTCSIGVTMAPDGGFDAQRLLSSADAAMDRAKQRGRARVEVFNVELARERERRTWLEHSLRAALDGREFHLVYQPQVDRRGERVCVEALLRWNPQGGVPVPPGEFIPLAEELGLIGTIGAWVLSEACRTAARWNLGGSPMRVGVNLSPNQLADPGLNELVAETLFETGLPAGLLEFELTETALREQGEDGHDRLADLRALGVLISLDDFGTGYSSFSRLQHLPLDALKIDRSFMDGIGQESGRSIVASIIELGHTLGLEVVAEGVETEEQRRVLEALGVDRLQGYLIGWPAPEPGTGTDDV